MSLCLRPALAHIISHTKCFSFFCLVLVWQIRMQMPCMQTHRYHTLSRARRVSSCAHQRPRASVQRASCSCRLDRLSHNVALTYDCTHIQAHARISIILVYMVRICGAVPGTLHLCVRTHEMCVCARTCDAKSARHAERVTLNITAHQQQQIRTRFFAHAHVAWSRLCRSFCPLQ